MTPAPLNLPRYTFLFGPAGHGQSELAAAIGQRDPALAVYDLEEPLRLATMELFFGGFTVDIDLSTEVERSKPNPLDASSSIGDWLYRLENTLRDDLGADILGRIAIKEIDRFGDTGSTFDRFLYRDAFAIADIRAFASRFGPNKCCVINCESMAPQITFAVGRYINLTSREAVERMAQLSRELSP